MIQKNIILNIILESAPKSIFYDFGIIFEFNKHLVIRDFLKVPFRSKLENTHEKHNNSLKVKKRQARFDFSYKSFFYLWSVGFIFEFSDKISLDHQSANH